ncbi:MAG: hypothetical protein ACR2OC_07970 [Solirubrobacterales bacterium]
MLSESDAAVVIEFQDWMMRRDSGRREEMLGRMAGHGYRPFTPTASRHGGLELQTGIVPSAGEDVLFLKS